MTFPRRCKAVRLAGFLGIASFLLPVCAEAAQLVAVRQVLPSFQLLAEDVDVLGDAGNLRFDDREVTGKVQDGTVIIKVAPGQEDSLALFLSDSSKSEMLERVVTTNGPVFCDLRALRKCFIKQGKIIIYLSHGDKVKTQTGTELIYLLFPGAGSIFDRNSNVKVASTGYATGQFNGKVNKSSLKCSSKGDALFPSQVHPVTFSITKEASGNIELCEVEPQLATGRQLVALSGETLVPRIFCHKESKSLLYFDHENPLTNDSSMPSQPVTLTLSGETATCSLLEDKKDHLLSVKLYHPEKRTLWGERAYSYTTVGGSRSILPVLLEAFGPAELGTPCSSQNFMLVYQPNYALHTEIEHASPLACHKMKRGLLRKIEREVLMMQLPGTNKWMELPAGTLLAASNTSITNGFHELYSYQPFVSTSKELQVHPLYTMLNKAQFRAAISITEEAGTDGFLYQTDAGKKVYLGYIKNNTFTAGSSFLFFAERVSTESARQEYRVAGIRQGLTLVLGSVPTSLIMQRDVIRYNTVTKGGPPVGREAEERLSMLHRLLQHLSSQGQSSEVLEGISELNKRIRKLNRKASELAAYLLRQYAPVGAIAKNVVVNMTYADKSGELSVVLRLPVNIRESPTSSGLIQQLHVALSILMEDSASRPQALANRITFYGTALQTLYKILESGHCKRCTDGKTDCSFCRAVMFRDFVFVDIQGLNVEPTTMPDSGSWAEYRGQEFLLHAESDGGSFLLGSDFDFHTGILTSNVLSPNHLLQLKDYATRCLNAHITSMVMKRKTSPGFCPGLNNYLKKILTSLGIESIAALINSREFRDAILEGCNIRTEDAVMACIEGDGEMQALQRLPEFRPLGRSTVYDYIRSLLSPILLGNIAAEFQKTVSNMNDFKATFAVAPDLREVMNTLATESLNNPARPLVDVLLYDEVGKKVSTILSAIDRAVAEKGFIKPAEGSAFYVGLWSNPQGGLKLLEELLSGSELNLAGQIAQADTKGPAETNASAARKAPADTNAPADTQAPTNMEATAETQASGDKDLAKLQKVKQYAKKLLQQQPLRYGEIMAKLNWPNDKIPETVEEAQQFVEAARGKVLVPGKIDNLFDHNWLQNWDSVSSNVSRDFPERHVSEEVMPFMRRVSSSNPTLYGQVCKRLGWATLRLPQNPEEAQSFVTAFREVRALQGPVKRWLSDLGEPVSQSMTWEQVRAVIDKAHGPHEKVPLFLPSSDKCQCVRSTEGNRCYIDALKTTEDVIFRLALLVPAAVVEHISPDSKEITSEAAAFCTATGIFVSAWQQQQVEAGFEHPNGRLAHSVLIERLKHAGDYILTEIEEGGSENTSGYRKRKRELNRLFSGRAMSKCLSLINTGAKVAREPAGIEGTKVASKSLYGGIVNTVGASALQVDQFVQTIIELGNSLFRRSRSSKSLEPLTGLIAALRISQRFKDCFYQSRDITFRSWYLMHIEGEAILRQLRKHKLGDEIARATYNLAANTVTATFDTAFKTLMATVTTQWEDAKAFKSLLSYTPKGGHVRLQEIPPEDFSTPADATAAAVLHYSPNQGNELMVISSRY